MSERPVETLSRLAGAVAAAPTPPETFRLLLEATRAAAPRGAVFLVREARLQGWGARGYPPDPAARMRQVRLDVAAPEVSAWLEGRGDVAPPAELGLQGAESAVASVRAGGRLVAVLVLERHGGEEPWVPAALDLLAAVAGLRLEVDLARRRTPPPSSPSPHIAAPPPPPAPETGLAPREEPSDQAAGDPRVEEAVRFARLVATDIRLYNEEAVVLGRRHHDLARRLGQPLERGREMFARRFADLGEDGLHLLHQVYVQVLAGGDRAALPYPEGGAAPP